MTNQNPLGSPNRPVSVRAISALLIALLAAPAVVWERKANAAPSLPAEQPPANVAPPQPFSVGEPVSAGGKLDAVRAALRDVFVAPELPAEFRAARVPGVLERLSAKGRSLAGATAELQPPVPPSAARSSRKLGPLQLHSKRQNRLTPLRRLDGLSADPSRHRLDAADRSTL